MFFVKPPKSIERGTCIKGLFWPPLEPKIESCFSPISSYRFIRRIAQVLQFHMETQNSSSHMTKMAAMLIYGKNLSEIVFSSTKS